MPKPPKEWTIMVYMAGDNNLSGDMAFSLEDLRAAHEDISDSDRARVSIMAYFDSYSIDAPTLYVDYSDAVPYRHVVQRKDLYHGKSKDPENSASADSIRNFVRWCIQKRRGKAQNYVIIVSGHSFGFYGTSFLRDQSTGRHLTLRRFRWALEDSAKRYLDNKKLAILGFDSCDMSMLEVGYELKDVAQTIVASEGSVPNSGWGYAPMLREFATNPEKFLDAAHLGPLETPEHIKASASSFVSAYIKHQRNFAIGGKSVDMTAWDLDQIAPLTRAVGDLGELLMDNLGLEQLSKGGRLTNKAAAVHNQTRAALLQSRVDSQAYMNEQSVDLKDFCQRLTFECLQITKQLEIYGGREPAIEKLAKQCRIVIEAVDRCVLRSGFSGDEFQFSKGISIFFPWTALTFLTTLDVYSHLRFNGGVWEEVAKEDGSGRSTKKYVQKEEGEGRNWGAFLYFYLCFVTFRASEDPRYFGRAFQSLSSGRLSDGSWSRVCKNWLRSASRLYVPGPGEMPNTPGQRDNWPVNRDSWPFNRDNWPINRDNWPLNRDNWPVNRDNWPLNRDNWPNNRDNWPNNRDNWPNNRDNWPNNRDSWPINREQVAIQEYMRIFGRIRNAELKWNAYGMWPIEEVDLDFGDDE